MPPQVAVFFRQQLLHQAIGEAGVVAHQGPAELEVLQPAAAVVIHDDDHRQAIDVRLKAAQLGGQPLRQHVHGPWGK